MKERIAAIFAIFLLALLPVQVKADVITEPEDSFYRRHRQECSELYRWYQANGEKGYAAMRDQPGGYVIANIENGTHLYMTYRYDGNGQWGYTEQNSMDEGIAAACEGGVYGWVDLSSLRPVYDSIAFREEHAAEISPFSGELDGLFAAQRVLLWDYPGSPTGDSWLEKLDSSFQLEDAYTDADGRLWGRIGYYRGWRDSWVCVSEPENDSLPAVTPEQPPLYPAVNPPVPKGYLPFILAAALVALAIALTLFLLRRFWKNQE